MRFKAVAIDEVLYDYRWHAGSLTSCKKEQLYGHTLERMLLKNREGFGKIDIEAEYYYNRCLYRARQKQGGHNPYRKKYFFSAIKHLCTHKIGR